MTPNELIKILKEYNFKNNSVRSFSLKYKITEKTILKYLKQHNIPYNNRVINYEMPRNCLGQYTFKYTKQSDTKPLVSDVKKTTNKSGQNQSLCKCEIKNKNMNNYHQKSSTRPLDTSNQVIPNKNNTSRVKTFAEFNKKYEKFFRGSS